jgi:hypothetical protein
MAQKYSFSGASNGLNPPIILVRGTTYTFNVTSTGHPLWIKTSRTAGTGSAYSTGVTNNGTSSGSITFVVPQAAPNLLYYVSENDVNLSNEIYVVNSTISIIGDTYSQGNNILSGSLTITGSLNITGSSHLTGSSNITGSQIITGSLNVTGSETIRGNLTVSGSSFVIGSSYLTGSTNISGSLNISGSITGSQGIINQLTASYAITASYVEGQSATASYALNANSASYVLNAISSSYASSSQNALTASFVNPLRQNVQITGSLFVSSSTVALSLIGSGSNVFSIDGTSGRLFSVDDSLSGSLFSVNTAAGLPIIEAFSDNTVRIGQFGQKGLFVSGSKVGIGKEIPLNAALDISGSIITTGSISATLGFTGSLFGTASFAITASYIAGLNPSQIATGSVTASVSVNATDLFLIKSGSNSLFSINQNSNTTLNSNLFIIKNFITQQPVLTVSQSIVKFATQSFDPTGTTDVGSIWFTSSSMYIGLE